MKKNKIFEEDFQTQESLKYRMFEYLIYLMKCRDQLRMNHWQTTSYAEHKATDRLIDEFTEYIDSLGETTLGYLGRPKINTTENQITDINLFSSFDVLNSLEEYTKNVSSMFVEYDGIKAILDEITELIQKGKYLLTLE